MSGVLVGQAEIICPVCELVIGIPVNCEILTVGELRTQSLHCEPDMSDLWAHMWTHEEADHASP